MKSGSYSAYRAAGALPPEAYEPPDVCEHGVPDDVGCYDCLLRASRREEQKLGAELDALHELIDTVEREYPQTVERIKQLWKDLLGWERR